MCELSTTHCDDAVKIDIVPELLHSSASSLPGVAESNPFCHSTAKNHRVRAHIYTYRGKGKTLYLPNMLLELAVNTVYGKRVRVEVCRSDDILMLKGRRRTPLRRHVVLSTLRFRTPPQRARGTPYTCCHRQLKSLVLLLTSLLSSPPPPPPLKALRCRSN